MATGLRHATRATGVNDSNKQISKDAWNEDIEVYDASTARTALGLGTLATQSGTFSGTSSGTNTGDQTSVSGNAGTATALQTARTIDGQSFNGTADITVIAPGTHAATSKATPVDADEIPLVDSAASNALKKLTWANLKATAKAYFDTLYATVAQGAKADTALQAASNLSDVASAPAARANLGVITTPGGRLTLESGVPVSTTDQTGKTSIYYTPSVHNMIALWDGSAWRQITFTEYTLALGTLTSGKPYDVFAYLNSGALALESLAWTDDATRATAVTLQDGRYCKSGDKTRLLLGTFYTTSTTETEDSAAKRFVWNAYNRRRRFMRVLDTTDSWSYSTATVRQSRGASSNQLDYVVGLAEDDVDARCASLALNSTSTPRTFTSGIGVDSTTAISGISGMSTCTNGFIMASYGQYHGVPGVGRHYLAWLERGNGSDTQTWFGDNGVNYVQLGIHGSVLG